MSTNSSSKDVIKKPQNYSDNLDQTPDQLHKISEVDSQNSKKNKSIKPSKEVVVQIQKSVGAKLPDAKTSGSAGYDLYANNNFPIIIHPGDFKLISTGIKLALPEGYCAEVYPRSGLAAKNGVTVLNTPGLIDSDFRGEVQVILINHGKVEYEVRRGDRIAQLRVKKLDSFKFLEVESLDETSRGTGGFGSTGI